MVRRVESVADDEIARRMLAASSCCEAHSMDCINHTNINTMYLQRSLYISTDTVSVLSENVGQVSVSDLRSWSYNSLMQGLQSGYTQNMRVIFCQNCVRVGPYVIKTTYRSNIR